LAAAAQPLLELAQQQHEQTGAKVRLAAEMTYAAESWTQARRVVYKAEALAQGPNLRFIVTTRADAPLALYDWYVQRDIPEQWIDDLKRACFADRLSCHRFWANQFRLLLHAAAYWLLDTLRCWLRQSGVAALRLDTLRLRLVKIGGWVRRHTDGFRLHLASSHPGEPLWHLLTARFQSP
jgi:Transposase DDE domain group 1